MGNLSHRLCGTRAFPSANRRSAIAQTPVTAVTDRRRWIGDTPIVVEAWGAGTKVPFEPGGTKQPWKGEAAACFVCAGITSSRALPTSSAGYWSPRDFSCILQAPPERSVPPEAIFCSPTTSPGRQIPSQRIKRILPRTLPNALFDRRWPGHGIFRVILAPERPTAPVALELKKKNAPAYASPWRFRSSPKRSRGTPCSSLMTMSPSPR